MSHALVNESREIEWQNKRTGVACDNPLTLSRWELSTSRVKSSGVSQNKMIKVLCRRERVKTILDINVDCITGGPLWPFDSQIFHIHLCKKV